MNSSTFFTRITAATLFMLLGCLASADAAVTVNKVFSPISVPVGGISTVTVTLQNSDTTTSVGITSVSDDIATMGGKAVLDPTLPGSPTTCGGVVSIAGSVVTLTGGTIPQATGSTTPGTCTFSFNVFGNQAGNGSNTILGSNVVTTAGATSSISQTLQVSSVSASVTAPPNISVPVSAPQTVTYTINNPAANVALVNSTPGAPLFSLNVNSAQAFSVTAATSTCGSTTTATLPLTTSGALPFTGGAIPAGGSCTVTLTVNSAVSGAVVNTTFPANGLSDDQLVTNTSAASSTVTFSDGRPNIAKAFNPNYTQPTGQGPPGADTSTLLILIQNVYTNTALTNAAITDNLPAGVVLQTPPNVSGNTCGGTITAVAGATSVALTGGTVPFNASGNASCQFSVNVTAASQGSYTNTIPAANFTANGITQAFNQAQSVLTTTANGGGVSASKAFNVGSAGVNTPFQVTLRFGSLASGSFTGGTFTDTFPTTDPVMIGYSDATHQPASSGCGTPTLAYGGGNLSMSGSNITIAAGGTCTITFWAVFPNTTPAVRTATNTATGSFPPTGGGSNVNTSASANINELPTLTTVNYVASNQGLINQTQSVQAQISDPSGTTDTSAIGVFNLNPGSVVLASASQSNFTLSNCPPGTTVTPDPGLGFFTVNAGTISQTCTITYNVIDVGGAQGTFTPAASTYSGTLTGNTPVAATGTNNVTFSTSNINITKQFLPANNIHAGGVATAQIGLTVQGVFSGSRVTQANGVTFADALPANMAFAPAPNVNFTGCTQAGQPAPSYVISGSTITLSNLTLFTTGSTQTTCNVDFDVTSSTLGSPTNTIAAHAVTSASTITNSQAVSASLTVLSGIEVQKTFTSPTLAIGSSEYVRFLITNTQTASSPSDGSLTDNMPSSLALASTTLGPSQAGDPALCGGAITTGTVGSSSFVLTGLRVPGYAAPVPGQCVVYVLIRASSTAAANTVATNTIPTGGLSYPSLGVTNVNPSTASGTLTPAPNVTLAKAFAPPTIASGATSVLTISIANTGTNAAPLSALALSDPLPAGVTVAATPAASTTCGAGTVTAVAGAGTVALAGGTVAAGATCTITVSVTGTIPGIYPNTIPASAVTSTQGATNGSPATATLNIGNISGVTLAKAFAPAQIATNGTSTLTVTVANTQANALALSAIAVNDTLPPNVTVAPVPNAATTCASGTVSAAPGGTTIGLAGASMPANTTCTFSVAVTSAAAGIYINTIPAGALSNAQGSTNAAPAQATLNVGNASGTGIAKTFTPAAIAANGTSVLTISIANNAANAVALSALGLTDALPANVKVANVPNAATTCGSGAVSAAPGGTSVTLSGGAVAANATCAVTVAVTSAIPGVYTNVIPANALTNAQNATNALPAQAILNVANASAVTVAKAFAPGVIAPGATATLTISLANTATNAVALGALALVDNLPANVTIAATPNASTTCAGGSVVANPAGTVVTLSGATMAPGSTCAIVVNVTGTIPNTYTNTIPAGAIATAQGATNASPAQASLIVGQPTLLVTKTSNPSGTGVSPGETIAYTIVIKNNGLQAETNAHVTDVLGNATLVPGSVTVNGQPAPDQVISAGQSFGTIGVGATVTIAYSATVNTGAATGTAVTNTATIAGDQPCSTGQCTAASPPNTVTPPILTASKLIDGRTSESVLIGQTVVYGITISNTGATPAINTTITDVVPTGISVVPGTVTLNGVALPTATLSGQTLTIPIAALAGGKSAAVAFNAKIGTGSGSASNTASVTASGVSQASVSNAALSHQVPATISVTKTASATTATVGDRVDYQIVIAPVSGIAYGATLIVDTLPQGELFAPGTARINGKPVAPAAGGNTLAWTLPSLSTPVTITYSTAIAPGVQQNASLTNTVNVTAVAPGGAGVGRGSGSASVLIVQTTFGSCYPITGRVYYDASGSGRFQDPDVGLGAVHIYLDDGESVVTDATGRYDFPCVHPGMHALRLDESTLPPGSVPFDDRNIDSEKSTRRLVHHIYDTTIIEDINFAVSGKPPGSAPAGKPPK